MPIDTTYDMAAGRFVRRVTCTSCCEHIDVDSVDRHAEVLNSTATYQGRGIEPGMPASEWIGWHSGHGRYLTRCRDCERHARAARPRSPRVSGGITSGRFNALGLGRRFGVELELSYPRGIDRYDIQAALDDADGCDGWRVKSDGSLAGNGWEVVSPVLEGEDGIEQVRVVCRVLSNLGGKPNRSCGLHVHHEIRDLSVNQVKQVFRSYSRNQHLIDGLVSESRRGRQQYCGALSDHALRQIENLSTLDQARQVGRFYSNLNLGAYGRYGTLEIRQHQGTVNAEKITSWIRFGQAVIDRAATEAQPARHERVRDFLGHLGGHLDETAKTFLLGRAVEFNAVAV